MIRAIIVVVLLIPFIAIVLPIMGLGFLLGLINKKIQYWIAYLIGFICSYLFYLINGAKITVSGLENIPRDGTTVLFVGNHRSYIDIPLLARYVPFPIAFIGKKSLLKFPFLNILMVMMGCLFLDRDDVRKAFETIKRGISKLERGESLLIFPEGTRSKTGDFLPFKQGSLKLAEKAHVPVLPFSLKGTNDVFGDHGFRLKPNRIWLTFGPIIYLDRIDEADRKQSAAYVQGIIEEMHRAQK